MTEDVVRALGLLCLGTRLKRLGERLQGDTQRLIDAAGHPVQAAQYPMLAALDRLGPSTVSVLVEALGVSQPAVTRTVSRLVDLDLVEARTVDGDQRKKAIALTAAGRRVVAEAKASVWPRIEAAVRDLCADSTGADRTGGLLDLLAALEDDLAAAPLDARMAARGATGEPA